MRSSKLASLLIATGIFIPLVSVPFAENYRRNAGAIENIQSMSLPLLWENYTPEFRHLFSDAEVGLSSKSQQDPKSTPSQPKPWDADPVVDASSAIKTSKSGLEPLKSVTYGKNNVFFDNSLSNKEIDKVLKAGKQQIENSPSKNLEFTGWTRSDSGIRLPFSFVVSGSLLVAFTGIVLLIFGRGRTVT